MTVFQKFIKQGIVFACVLSLCASAVFAQQNTGTLSGRVVDELGGLIVGATVTATNASGVQKTAVTTGEGRYVLPGLAPGKYTVRVNVKDFALYENTEVDITGGETTSLEVLVTVKLGEEEISVSATNPRLNTDPENSASTTVLRGADLDILSDDPDQLAADLQALSGVDGGPNGSQILVDGFSRTRIPSKSSILEVRVNSNPFTAEQDDLGFGRVEIITKPGADKLNGQAFFNFNDESLNARNPFAPNRAPFQSKLYGMSLSGPIQDKISSFFLDFERRDITENAVVSATTLDSAFNITPFSQVVITPQRRTNISPRFDYQINKNNTLSARYNYLKGSLENAGVGGFSLPSRAYDTSNTSNTLQLTETMIVSPTTLNVARFQFARNRSVQDGDNSLPTINVQGAFIGGGAQIGASFNDTDRYELNNITTWVNGNHTWKAGGRLRYVRQIDVAPSNFGGTFVFSSLEQYRNVQLGLAGARPEQFSIAGGNPQASVNQWDFGVFAQDDWRLRHNLTLSLGLRYEAQTNTSDKFDLAPRIAFAWAPGAAADGKQPKVVIRGGFGIFYYRFLEDLTLQANRFDSLNQQQFIITQPDFFAVIPTLDQLASGTISQTTRRLADNLQTPYSMKGVISFERQLPRNTTLSLIYFYERDRQLTRSRNINAPLPGTFDPRVPNSGVRPFGDLSNIFVFESGGRSIDNTLFININSRFNKKLSFFSRVGISRETGDSEGAFSFPANPYSYSAEYSRVSADPTFFTFVGATYTAPWNITFNALVRASSPARFNITTGRDTNGDAVFTERPAFATDLSKPGVISTDFGVFDPNPELGQQLIPRNFGQGPAFFTTNLRASKTVRFGGGSADSSTKPASGAAPARVAPYSLTFSIQATNLFNNTNEGQIIGNLNSPLFGRANTTATTPRRFDLQLRFSF